MPRAASRKVYADAPAAVGCAGGSARRGRAVPDARALPFDGVFNGMPTRDYYKIGGAMMKAGYREQALPYLEEALRRIPEQPEDAARHWAASTCRPTAWRRRARRSSAPPRCDPEMPEAWNDLGGVEAAAGDPREALRDVRTGAGARARACPTRW